MLLHIGYLKTGTTTLQHHVFSRLGRFIGKDGKAEDTVRVAAIDLLLGLTLPPQSVDATHALNLSAGVSNSSVFRGRSLS